jgi:D-Tyr-tRNAtyr deacylase
MFCSSELIYVGSQTRDRAKAGPRLMKKIADLMMFNQSKGKSGSYAHAARVGIEDLTIFNQSKGKSGSYAHAARVGMQNHSKGKSLLHLTS